MDRNHRRLSRWCSACRPMGRPKATAAQRPAKMRARSARVDARAGSLADCAAFEYAEIRQRIVRFRKRNIESAAMLAPASLQFAVGIEPGDVDLPAKADRKLFGLAGERDDRAGRQRLAAIQDDG